MPMFTVTIGVAVVLDKDKKPVEVRKNPQTELRVKLEAANADAAFDHVQARLEELLAAPVGS